MSLRNAVVSERRHSFEKEKRSDGHPAYKYLYGRTQRKLKENGKAWKEDQAAGNMRKKQYTFAEWAEIWFEHHNPTYFRKLYKAELDKIEGVRYLRPHSCRHTYVSQMQALGIDIETIKSIVGHADMNMTRHYLHVQDPIRQAAVQKLSDAFEKNSKKV